MKSKRKGMGEKERVEKERTGERKNNTMERKKKIMECKRRMVRNRKGIQAQGDPKGNERWGHLVSVFQRFSDRFWR